MGKRNLEQAIKDSGVDCKVQWLPFFLDPNTPPEGEDLFEHLAAKYGRGMAEKFRAPGNPLDTAGRKVGINFDKSRRFINTVSAHRLMEHANTSAPEKADSLMEAMFHAYFEQAKDLSTPEELMAVARSVGLEHAGVEQVLAAGSTELKDEVMASVRDSQRRLRVSGVPFFIIEPVDGSRPIAFSGAQPADIIAEQLLEASGD